MAAKLQVITAFVTVIFHALYVDQTVYAAVNGGVVPQAFFDFWEQHEQSQRTPATGTSTRQTAPLPPAPSSPAHKLTSTRQTAPLPPAPSSPAHKPTSTRQTAPLPPAPSSPAHKPTSPSQPQPSSQQPPSAQELQLYQQILKQQQQQLQQLQQQLQQQTLQVQLQQKQQQQQEPKPAPTALPTPPKQPPVQQPPPKQELTYQQLQEEIQKQIQQRGAPPTPVLQPPQPATNAFAPASHHPRLPNFPAPHYQFKPPPPPPTTAPPPPVVITDRRGIIDFVPVEHKKARPPQQSRGVPAHHSLSGRVGADWIARQVRGPNPGHRASTFASVPWAQRFQNMASAMSRLSPGSTNSDLRTSTRSPYRVAKVSPFANMPLPREFQAKAMAMGRQMCITQFYESHGCIDPVKYLPPGTRSNGLMMGCSSYESRNLCRVAGSRVPGGVGGKRNGLAMAMMMQGSSSKAMLERCLTTSVVTKAMTKMFRGGGAGGGGMNPATMMMMMGGGGEGGGGIAAMAMMNMMKQTGRGGGGGERGGAVPEGAALPLAPTTPFPGHGQAGGDKCMAVLPLIMSQGGEGGILSPEMATTVRDMRRQMLPYTCQDIHYGVFFRMCCPGHVPSPSMMEMMTSCGK